MLHVDFARNQRLLEIYKKAMEEDQWATALRASELLMKTKAPTDLGGFLIFLFQQVLPGLPVKEIKRLHTSFFALLNEKKAKDFKQQEVLDRLLVSCVSED